MNRPPVVLPEYGPSLPELYGSRFRGLSRAIQCVAVLLVAVVVILVLRGLFGDGQGSETYRQAGAVAFNFRYASGLKGVAPEPGELVHLEARRGKLFIQSFAVSPLRLPPYQGDVAGILPVTATKISRSLAHKFPGFTVVQETRSFVNTVPGYAIVFKARLGKRALFGRYVLLPKPLPGGRDGVSMLILSTPASGTYNAETVGSIGATKLPFRSFRFDGIEY